MYKKYCKDTHEYLGTSIRQLQQNNVTLAKKVGAEENRMRNHMYKVESSAKYRYGLLGKAVKRNNN